MNIKRFEKFKITQSRFGQKWMSHSAENLESVPVVWAHNVSFVIVTTFMYLRLTWPGLTSIEKHLGQIW